MLQRVWPKWLSLLAWLAVITGSVTILYGVWVLYRWLRTLAF